jgi:hypothetical protein
MENAEAVVDGRLCSNPGSIVVGDDKAVLPFATE